MFLFNSLIFITEINSSLFSNSVTASSSTHSIEQNKYLTNIIAALPGALK